MNGHLRKVLTAIAVGMILTVVHGCSEPQKSVPVSETPTVQKPTPTSQIPVRGVPIPKLTPIQGSLVGLVLGGGAPIANSTVTLWAANSGEPRKLEQKQSGADGRFEIPLNGTSGNNSSLYVVVKGGEPTASTVKGDNSAIALMSVLGSKAPSTVVVNEM